MSRHSIVLEVLRAVCVLALLFLNFAHQPAPAAAASGDVLSLAQSLSFCGEPVADDKAGHAPCHACRIGASTDLPPAPQALPAPCVVAAVRYGDLPVIALPDTTAGPHSARGPPRIA